MVAAQVGGHAPEEQDDAGNFRGGRENTSGNRIQTFNDTPALKKAAALQEPTEIKGRVGGWRAVLGDGF